MSNYENHTTGSLIVLVGIGLVAVLMGLPSHTFLSGGSSYSGGPFYTPGPSFETQSLNDRMLISQTFQLDTGRATNGRATVSQPLAQMIPVIRRSFRRNPHPEAVLYGDAANVPVGWAYLEFRNPTRQPRHLVLSMPQYRSDQVTLWRGKGGRFVRLGTLGNNTPLGERFYPFFNYAFPFTIPPQATVPLLLRSQRYAGYHELDVQLTEQRTRNGGSYAQQAFVSSIRDGITVIVFLLLAVVALLVGWLSASRLLRWFGVYLVSLTLWSAYFVGYLSLAPYPAGLSLNADTVGLFIRILINITVHPFFYYMIKPAIRQPRLYKQVVASYCVVCTGLMSTFLLPPVYFDSLRHGVTLGMMSVSNLNIGWLFVWAVLAYVRVRVWSPLAICLLGLSPMVISQLASFLRAAGQDTYRHAPSEPLYILFVLSYLTFDQFRRELVTRQRMQTQMQEVDEYNNVLRRQEIEGIGRELHDQVGNTLATALSYLGRIPLNPDKLRSILLTAISELRFLSHNLVKDDNRPLTEKIETLVSRFNDFTPIHLIFADYTRQQINQLPMLKQQNLYRIIQELLTNVIRHSGATQASVEFFCEGTTVDVSVEDDGGGFDLSASQTRGIGIQTIYKRAALSGITVQFDPTPTGTGILLQTTLDTPVPSHANPNYSY
ncbi:hypothetical protein GK091_24335 [Spirosoma agri]|uniref:histidine kinase n=1 Tax=Spirosoma agri TaxID=1987381 RepID=A0A6M0IRN1_9BACT|nr:7TM-DISM domain-containing protein [Spirosoma agri]NEU70031.1 hypothetical protein [Spirosoma agri]